MMQKKTLLIFVVVALIVLIIAGFVFTDFNKKKNSEIYNSILNKSNEPNLEDFNESVAFRYFPSTNISSGEQVRVIIKLHLINKEAYYAIEEHIPDGWAITYDGGGKTEDSNKLAWVTFSAFSSGDTSLTYTVKAPSTTGNYTFDGIYQFEGMNIENTTIGQTTVTVT